MHLGTAAIPDGGELRLMRRGSEYSIMLGGNELMNSRLSGSEEALATLALDRLRPGIVPHILIGGLGMGFTLRAALASLGPRAEVIVTELVPGVVGWARTEMAEIFAGSLDDPRVSIAIGDVAEAIAGAAARYDAILLDVDNGPDGLTSAANDRLYGPAGLQAAYRALRSGGVLAVWSSGPDPAFTARLGRAGFQAEEVRVKAGRGRGARHVLWFGTKPG
jgi:spermidine synthase